MSQELKQNQLKHQTVPAGKIHQSKILPHRSHGEKIAKSVKKLGVLQHLIVRPLPDYPGEYELIDGSGRLESLQANQMVEVDILEANDDDAFKISNATFTRQNRTALDRARFYQAWLDVTIKQNGTRDGAQVQLVRYLDVSESLISQYLAVNKLFETLKTLNPNLNFSALKIWDLNRLYQLSRLIDSPKLLNVAIELEKESNTSIEDLKALVDEAKTSQPETPQMSPEIQKIVNDLNLIPSETSGDKSISAQVYSSVLSSGSQRKLTNLSLKAIQNLSEVNQKLSFIMLDIENYTEKYANYKVLGAVRHVVKLLEKLQLETRLLQIDYDAASLLSNGTNS